MFWWWCQDRSRLIRRKILDLNFLKRSHLGLGIAIAPKKLEHTDCWWKKSWTTCYIRNRMKKQIFWMSTGTGFHPSPVFNYFLHLFRAPNLTLKTLELKIMPWNRWKNWPFENRNVRFTSLWKLGAKGWTIFGALALLAASKNYVNAPIPSFLLKQRGKTSQSQGGRTERRLSENGMALGKNGPKPCFDLGFVVKGRCSLLRCADPDRTWISSKYWGYFCRCVFWSLAIYIPWNVSLSLSLFVFCLQLFEMVILPKQTLTQQEETCATLHYP